MHQHSLSLVVYHWKRRRW